MSEKKKAPGRRAFLQSVVLSAGAAAQTPSPAPPKTNAPPREPVEEPGAVQFPRVFRGRQLSLIAFPLGGVAAGSLSLGGRGQLRDWEIFNRPDKGYSPSYALPSIWAQTSGGKPVARVLEARILPPYQGASGLGSENAPGLSRLASATFTGEFPLAHIDFEDRAFPVRVSLDAFSPFVPHEPDDSGLPVAILRYRVTNPARSRAKVSIAFSIDNPVAPVNRRASERRGEDPRVNEYRSGGNLQGLVMTNPGVPREDPQWGSFALALLGAGDGKVTHLRGWEKGRWWNSPLLFWDDFSSDGELGPEPESRNAVGALCLSRTIEPGAHAEYTFLLAWHFPNRTPGWCGWSAPKGEEDTVIGNFYATRFAGAWEAAEYAAAHLENLESKTRRFAAAIRESTLPAAVKDAASANLSTLVATTSFRTADGAFHGFEGVNDKRGCCFGNCTHVWNYETATAHLFPSFARSLRAASLGYSMDDAGAIHFRQMLPDGKERSGFAAADGQMGQVLHAYLDWKLSGDADWLREVWPRVKKALEFAWVPGGWDANRDGVMEGVQHNTYDVEFYGPNPQCGIYYLGALRAGEEMARAVGDSAASEYRRLFDSGSRWIDANLFNGEYYIQKVRPWAKSEIAPSLRSAMGADDPEHPEYQVGAGCLADQLVGHYLAEVCGLGDLLSPRNVRAALASVYRYNHKRTLYEHDSVERTFALNGESALVICDYGKAQRPRIPFPYFAEVFTGVEYSTAAHMIYAGMEREGVECIRNIRARYDGERRNPWDEAECGHHYARAMAAWSGLLALSGFRYDGPTAGAVILPRAAAPFRCFWSSATGWGVFTASPSGAANRVELTVDHGSLAVRSCVVHGGGGGTKAARNGRPSAHRATRRSGHVEFEFSQPVELKEGDRLRLDVLA